MNNTKEVSSEKEFIALQNSLLQNIELKNRFNPDDIQTISGIDLAYWQKDGKDFAVCCIVTIDYKMKNVIDLKYSTSEITVPYIAGYLSFRELPLILKTYDLLVNKPDLIMFDGNGYLHHRHMGIATHASFYLNKPTIGIAKSYLKIENVEFVMPVNEDGAYSDIVVNDEIYGRALRTHKGVFVSCGNWIDLETSTNITLNLVECDSRQPLPTRLADIETKKLKKLKLT